MRLFIYLNVILPVILIIMAFIRHGQVKRVSKLGLVLPSVYILCVYYRFLSDPSNWQDLQILIRIAISLLLLSLVILTGSDIIAFRIQGRKQK